MKFILGQKLKMSQIFDQSGRQIPITWIETGPCKVLQIKTKEKDGYQALQIGFKEIEKKKKIKKTMKGKEFRYIREERTENKEQFKVGDKIDASIFKEGDKVSVSGISKGKGFAGVVKRWGFHGRSKTHGSKHEERTPGSVGAATPTRVVRGKKMAGRMGSERVTVKDLKVIKVDKENNLLALKGAVPGRKGTLLEIKG